MKPYATLEDYSERYGSVPGDKVARVKISLLDASLIINAQNPKTDDADVLKAITCAMVNRATSSFGAGVEGLTGQTISAGVYSQQFTYSNPTGDLYLTKGEKKLLGIGRQKYFPVSPKIGRDSDADR